MSQFKKFSNLNNEDLVIIPDTSAASAGDFLSFDGTDLEWANPPEGVYVLNYSDVTSYNDIDAERAGSQPTFIKIDSSVPLTVQGISGPTTINMENQIMQLTDYNVYNGWHVFRGYNMGSFPGNSPTSDRVGSSYHFEVVLQIFRPEITQNTKLWSVFGDYMDGRNVFSTEPQPYTVSYQNGKGGDLSGKTGRSTAVQFTASNGEYRKNLLMPYEIQDHDFSNDTTPEQIQFMGWGVTSNRAGYRTINEVPASTSAESGKVLKVGSNGTTNWGNEIFIATYHVTPFADILAAKNRGEIIMLLWPPLQQNMHGPLLSLFNMTDTFAYFTAVVPGTTSSPSNFWTVKVSTDGTTDTWSSPIINKCAQLGSTTIDTSSSPVIMTGLNNGFATMSLNRSSFTLIVNVDDGEVINFALEIENTQSCQLTIQKQVGDTTTTLKHSVAGGNTLEANKTYQVTAVGNCWTLAEFEA